MSGHSKWAGIKHKKAIVDARRGQVFTKVTRELTVAAREGGPDVEGNFRLRLAMQKAREVNMPADNIERAIQRGAGGKDGVQLEEVRYEGYGPHGVAVMVDTLTDNRNRTVAAIRNAFTRSGGALGEANSVGWMFNQQGLITRRGGQARSRGARARAARCRRCRRGRRRQRRRRRGASSLWRRHVSKRSGARSRSAATAVELGGGDHEPHHLGAARRLAGAPGAAPSRQVSRITTTSSRSTPTPRYRTTSLTLSADRCAVHHEMRVLGVDPGLARTGVAIVDGAPGHLVLLHAACIETVPQTDEAARLAILFDFVVDACTALRPEVAAVEEFFFSTNRRTAMRVSEARGVVLCALAREGIAIAEYTPTQVKEAVCGYGAARKPQVARMVANLLGVASDSGPRRRRRCVRGRGVPSPSRQPRRADASSARAPRERARRRGDAARARRCVRSAR